MQNNDRSDEFCFQGNFALDPHSTKIFFRLPPPIYYNTDIERAYTAMNTNTSMPLFRYEICYHSCVALCHYIRWAFNLCICASHPLITPPLYHTPLHTLLHTPHTADNVNTSMPVLSVNPRQISHVHTPLHSPPHTPYTVVHYQCDTTHMYTLHYTINYTLLTQSFIPMRHNSYVHTPLHSQLHTPHTADTVIIPCGVE